MENYTLNVELRSYGDTIDSHRHGHHQLVLPSRGALEIEVDGRGGVVDGACGALVPSGAWHSYQASRDNRFLVLDLPLPEAERLSATEALWERANQRPFMLLDQQLGHLLRFLVDADGSLLSRTRGAELLLLALAEHSAQQDDLPRRLLHALQYLEQRLADTVSTAQAASAVGLSGTQLNSLFHRHLGVSCAAWLRDCRLQHAEQLLSQTSLSLAEIALRCGFSEQSALTRCLRRERGTTPAALRRNR